MTLTYDLFWSFRSPYSYLVTPRLLGFERDFDVQANVRPVYPIAVRIDGFFKTVNPFWWSYLRRDVARTAEMLGLPHSPPNPDPIVMDLKSGEVSKEQPYIGRLTRLGVAAAERGKDLQLLKGSARSSSAARVTGTSATMWPALWRVPVSTFPSSTAPLRRMRSASKLRLPAMRLRRRVPVIGACR